MSYLVGSIDNAATIIAKVILRIARAYFRAKGNPNGALSELD